jgi:hypothetical protein
MENSRTAENYIKQEINFEPRNSMRGDENLKRFQKKAFDFSFLEHETRNENKEESFQALVHPYHKESGGAQQMPDFEGNLFQSNSLKKNQYNNYFKSDEFVYLNA